MMKLRTYACLSLLATAIAIHHAFRSRGQFYPAAVHLSTSKICLVLLLNTAAVAMYVSARIVQRLFLGRLREAEIETLNERSWRELMEILFAITIFRQDFTVAFFGMVAALFVIKALHWLAQKRIEYVETTPSVSRLSHLRICGFLVFLLAVDSMFLYSYAAHLYETWQPSVSLYFAFEYMILGTTAMAVSIKYIFFVIDILMEGQFEKKATYTFHLELVRDLLHLSMYLCFFLTIFVNYGIPLHLIHELYATFRNLRIRVADYIRYRKITSNMNERFPDATPEELQASDATCIICREEMVTAKKLRCGHLFHVHCLRSWLERQTTCPTCRSVVVPPENGTVGTGQQGGPSPPHQTGAGSRNDTSAQDPGVGAAGVSLNHHQIRLQAAAAAASVYGKSFVFPPPNIFAGAAAYANAPHMKMPTIDNAERRRLSDARVSLLGAQESLLKLLDANLNLIQQIEAAIAGTMEGRLSDASSSLSVAQENLLRLPDASQNLRQQIEVLKRELELLKAQEVLKASETSR
ncbi:E3 ubiquitin protein ligase RIN2 [Acorus calamus]|uniref:RING-type E3 ubiquitin transferase n=1 Tax=Acorus calamus TaxID=4465 RepID=A0AAV9F5T0_ACOCL|nr:E3 ubiquitin protein ligase RIN2 [Acorus calamus]